MSSLKHVDKVKIEAFLGMGSGYVCDFNDVSFRDFILENSNIDIYQNGYDIYGTSKVNRLRLFWKRESDHVTGKVLRELFDYWKTVKAIARKFNIEDQILYQDCLKILEKLESEKTEITSEYNLERRFMEVLLQKGYPEESLVFGWKQNGVKFNLAIIEPTSKKLLSVFEFLVASPIVVSTTGIREVVAKYKKLTTDPKVPLYVVYAVQGWFHFTLTKILYQTKNSDLPHYLNIKEVLDFNTLKNNILNMTSNKTYSEMSDEELEAIVRLHENPNIPTSRFNYAKSELDLRYKKRGIVPTINFNVGGSIHMNNSNFSLNAKNKHEVKTKNGEPWFSMQNPIVYILVIVFLAGIGYLAYIHNLPLKFL